MKKVFSILLIVYSITGAAQVTMMNDVSISYLQHLIEIGKAYYPKFKWTAAKTDAAKCAYDKAKWGVFDFISLSYVYYPGNTYMMYGTTGTSSYLSGYEVGVFLNVGNMLSKPATVKEAKKEFVAAKMDKDVVDLDVEQEIRKRYFTYIETSNILKLKSMATTDADDVLKDIKYKFEKGEVTFDVYNQALLSFSTYSQEKIVAESSFLIAKSSLEELLGTTLENIK